jgi:hypothetical protein
MNDSGLITRYNYDEFVPEKFSRWLNFENSPSLGQRGPDFPLWKLENRSETSLSAILATSVYTIVEFGSLT